MTDTQQAVDRTVARSEDNSGFFLDYFFRQSRSAKDLQVGLIVAFVGTLFFYLHLVGAFAPGHVHWPGLMLTGDQRMFYFPSYMEGYRRFWHGGLTGIDFLVNDGASLFAYRPNEMPFYPPYILSYLVADCSDPRIAIVALTVITILHHLVGTFFSFIFVRRYLGFPTLSAVLATVVYTLTWYAGVLAGQETFYFQMMLLPAVACALCWLMQTPSRLAPIWVSPLFLTMILTNYGPTMIAALGLAIVAALLGYGLWVDSPRARTAKVLIAPLASMALAALVCLPYIVAQLQFKKVMGPTADDIDQVAHDLALSGPDPINAFSEFGNFNRQLHEELLIWGLIPAFICFFGLYVLIKRRDAIKPLYLWVCGVAAVVYLLVLLPTFGAALEAPADAFYYAVPILGRMHIFQRNLGFSQFFFAILVSGMATIALRYASQTAKCVAAFAGIAIWLAGSAALMAWGTVPTDLNPLLLELFMMAIVAVALSVARITPALIVVSVLTAAVGLHLTYILPMVTATPSHRAIEAEFLGPQTRSVVDFLKANKGDKALPKMALATTEIEAYLNRNLPWVISKEVKVMNYQGYPPHLANLADYSAQEFGPYGVFDVSWLKETGLDFVYWKDSMPAQLAPFTAAGFELGPTLTLPGGAHLSKVSLPSVSAASGVRLNLSPGTAAQWPMPLMLDLWEIKDGALVKGKDGKPSQFGYSINPRAGLTYQVDFDAEAVSPGQLRVALANQVLDVVNVTGKIHFSRRVTATGPGDLWILSMPTFAGSISNLRVQATAPSAADAAVRLNLSPDTVAQWPTPLSLDLWQVKGGSLVKGKDGRPSQLGYRIDPKAGVAYQVDFDAEASSPGQLRVALANQVLDTVNVGGRLHFSKRITATGPGDLWILSMPTFAGSISNLRVQAMTPAAPPEPPASFDNGIFRYTGPKGSVVKFDTNYTTRISTVIDAPTGGVLTYLLWPNPRMTPYLDGRRVAWANPGEKPSKVQIGPGRHRFEMRFRDPIGVVSYATVILYLLLLAASVAGPYALPILERRRGRLLNA
jgi:hypothetical protein